MTTSVLNAETLRSFEPIGALSADRLNELAGLCSVEKVDKNFDPFRLHSPQGQSIYLLAGKLEVAFADGTSSVVVGGHADAVWPLTSRCRPAIVHAKAITELELLRIDNDMLDIMVTWDELVGTARSEQGAQTDSIEIAGSQTLRVQRLASAALSRLPPAHIDELLRCLERVEMRAGEVVLREGEVGDYYYIIESGHCAVLNKRGASDTLVAELGAGDAFGEEALVTDNTRNATVRMQTDGVLLRLSKLNFIRLLREPLLKTISWHEAEQHIANGAVWLDVRYPAEYRNDALPNAFNLPLQEIRKALGRLDFEREYIVYCQSGRRSSAAAFLLAQRGYRVFWLAEGMPSHRQP